MDKNENLPPLITAEELDLVKLACGHLLPKTPGFRWSVAGMPFDRVEYPVPESLAVCVRLDYELELPNNRLIQIGINAEHNLGVIRARLNAS